MHTCHNMSWHSKRFWYLSQVKCWCLTTSWPWRGLRQVIRWFLSPTTLRHWTSLKSCAEVEGAFRRKPLTLTILHILSVKCQLSSSTSLPHLSRYLYVRLDGTMSIKKRAKIVERFNSPSVSLKLFCKTQGFYKLLHTIVIHLFSRIQSLSSCWAAKLADVVSISLVLTA